MKIGVLSDTHIPGRARRLPAALMEGLQHVDYILHAGDWQSLDVYKQLKKIAPIEGVAGNVDDRKLHRKLGKQKIVTFDTFKIGLIHGHGGKRKHTMKRAYKAFNDKNVQMIIFGHTHQPLSKTYHGVWMFNPGSPTHKRKEPYFSYGLLTIEPEGLSARHIYY